MSLHLSRAELLLAQSRPADAEREARLALGQRPDDPLALGVLARALVDQNREEEALDPARAAVSAAPDSAYSHHVLAHVLLRLKQPRQAMSACEAALRLAPDDADLLAQRAGIRLAQRDWAGALEDSEAALRIQPEDTFAQNLRATALRQLGRTEEAGRVGARTLEQDPEDAFSHSTQGWTLLQAGDSRRAQEHFLEALRLDPNFEPARQGMLEALKARNPLYRGMLAYFLWMGRQSGRIQWAFILVTFFGQRAVRRIAADNPSLGPVLWPLLGLFYAFVYLTWTAVPMFNLLLCLNRFGRHVLSAWERRDAVIYGASVALIAAAAVWMGVSDESYPLQALIAAAMVSVSVAATVSRDPGRARRILTGCTIALAAVAALGVAMLAGGAAAGWLFLLLFFLGFLGFQFAANALRD